jgi:hypothetical protein
MFLLKEYMVFAVASSLTRSVLFRIFSPFIVLLILQELKCGKLSSKFALTLFIDVDLHNKNPVYYIIFYFLERILLYPHTVFNLLMYL